MYNENIKLNYILTRPESMRANYKNFFIASGKRENQLGRILLASQETSWLNTLNHLDSWNRIRFGTW